MSAPVVSGPDVIPRTTAWGRGVALTCLRAAAVCAAVFAVGLFVAPRDSWNGFLLGFHVLLGLAITGPVGLAFLHLSGAKWSRNLEAVPRAMTAALPAAGVMGLLLIFGVHSLFEWSHASAVEGDHLLEAKAPYLNAVFFAVRLVVFFVLWVLLGRTVVAASRRGDAPADKRSRLRTAAVFLLVFAPTWSLASIDWLQSLEPHWFSSIYALLTLGAAVLAGLAAATLMLASIDDGRVREDQWGDIGALLLSLSLFWAYIWYCQYLLIWYTNMPEETPWYAARLTGAWGILTKFACTVFGALPFALLLFRRLRRSRRALVRIAALVLVGRLLDLVVMAGPPLMGDVPSVGLFVLVPVIGQALLFVGLAVRALASESTTEPAPSTTGDHTPAGAAASAAA